MGDQLTYALEQGVPFMVLFGEDEMAQGQVKVKVGSEASMPLCIYCQLIPCCCLHRQACWIGLLVPGLLGIVTPLK